MSSSRNGHSEKNTSSCIRDKVPFVLPHRDDDTVKDIEYNPETNEIRWLGKAISVNEIHGSKTRHVVLVASPTTDLYTYVTSYAQLVLEGEVPALRHVELVLYLKFNDMAKDKMEKLRTVFIDSQIAKNHVNSDAMYKWIIKNQDKVLIITDGWDKMVKLVNETRQTPVEYEGSGSPLQILQKLTKGDIFGKSWVLTVAKYVDFELSGDFRPQRVVMVNDDVSDKVLAGLWMHAVANRIFSRFGIETTVGY